MATRLGIWCRSKLESEKLEKAVTQERKISPKRKFLGSVPGRTDFSRIFIFVPPDFFADLVAGFFSHFCGKKCPEKSSRKIPGKILQNLYNKNPRHISAEGPGQKFLGRTSRGHSGVIRADIPAQHFGQGGQSPGKTSISARTSMTRRRERPRP